MATSSTIALACELISKPSVTPNDAGCQLLMRQRLEAIGFHCETLIFGDGDCAVENLWAMLGSEGPLFVFAGHTDVVPSGPTNAWTHPPFEPIVDDQGRLYGRGSADMKGSLAAMITATEALIESGHKLTGRIGFLITADEEGIAKHGTVDVVQWLKQQNISIDWCLVGEPSSTEQVGDVIKNGRRGSLGAKMIVKGKQGHVAYPHLARNPIHELAPALSELASTEWDQGNEFFPATTFQVSNIHSGTGATNVIPGHVEVIFNFRFSTETSADELQARTESILNKHSLDVSIDWHLSGEPFLTPSGPLVDAARESIKDITGRNTLLSTAGGTSDGRFIAPTGAQVVELGPVNKTIHQVDEHIQASELDELHKVYLGILKRLV